MKIFHMYWLVAFKNTIVYPHLLEQLFKSRDNVRLVSQTQVHELKVESFETEKCLNSISSVQTVGAVGPHCTKLFPVGTLRMH